MLVRYAGQLVTTREDAYAFIDGGYVREIVRSTLKREDIIKDVRYYAKFLSSFLSRLFSTSPLAHYRLVRALYYDAIVPVEDDPEMHRHQKEFFNALEKLIPQFEVKLGTLVMGKRPRQKGVDTLLAIDMITKAFMNHYQIAVLVAGDRDFVSVVRAVKEFTGKLVCGVYDPNRPIADELLRAFDLRRPLMGYDFTIILEALEKGLKKDA